MALIERIKLNEIRLSDDTLRQQGNKDAIALISTKGISARTVKSSEKDFEKKFFDRNQSALDRIITDGTCS